jgi:uncharacterized membrane protein SirB2
MLASYYADIRFIHVGCVALSGTLFTVRGLLRIGDFAVANHRLLRVTSYIIDTTLLASAILLTLVLRQYPFVEPWLTAKVLLLALYIALGSITLKRAQTRLGRIAALLGSLTTFVAIVDVAIAHDPAGWLRLTHHR